MNRSSRALQKYGTDENRCEHQIRLVSGVAFPSTGFYSNGIHSPAFRDATFRYALHYRAVSASASFILLLFIYWKFHLNDRQNRSLFFRVKCMPTSFPGFLLLPILILPLTASSPSQPQQRHIKVQQDLQYTIERNWPVKKNS